MALDSRQVCPGNLFLACAGIRSHGLLYLGQARAYLIQLCFESMQLGIIMVIFLSIAV